MINTSELRRGNWIAYKGNPFKVVEIYENRISANFSDQSFSERAFDPISLSPEWLEKCGFDFYDDDQFMQTKHRGIFFIRIIEQLALPEVRIGDMYFSHVIYLHQLQNLYFALTRTELIINL